MGDAATLRDLANRASASREERLGALSELASSLSPGERAGESNNHVHTIYSFSPYAPATAALRCLEAGLEAAGSVDHDSIAAAPEMREACAILGLGCVTGCELRVSFKDGPFARRKINNPDSEGLVYMTIQGVPAAGRAKLDAFIAPIRARRLERTRMMAAAASGLLGRAGLGELDFESDVVSVSKAAEGGGVTERHLLAAVARKLVERFGRGPALVSGLESALGVKSAPRLAALLSDPGNPTLVYDLLGVLKSGFLDRVFIQPDGIECPPAREAVAAALSVGAIPAYAYLGDVGESPTGDKKAEKFEDDFLGELFDELVTLGFPAVCYMPPRNSREQLARVRALCAERGFLEISGVDINSPRQSFNCPELRQPEFAHLRDATWALVAHEALSELEPRAGLLSSGNPLSSLPIPERVAAYARAGRALDASRAGSEAARFDPESRRPESAATLAHDLLDGRFSR